MTDREQLRERLAKRYYRERWTDDDWETRLPVHKVAYYEVVDAILSEIKAAGYVLQQRGESVDLRDKEAWGSVWETVDDILGVRLQMNRNGLFSFGPAREDAIRQGWSIIEPSGMDDLLKLRDALNTLFADPESQEYRGDLDPLEGGE